MRERAEMAGGRSSLFSLPGAGTTLEVWLPREVPAATETPREARTLNLAPHLVQDPSAPSPSTGLPSWNVGA
jgi:hypothetical protein